MRETTQEERARLWLHYAVEYNSRLFFRVAGAYHSLTAAQEAFRAGDASFFALSERVRSRLQTAAAPGFVEDYLERLERKRISFTYPGDARYPKLLAQIEDPPSVLYYIGNIDPEPELAIAVIGSRRPTQYGLDTAKRFALALAEAGATVVSGMASGVDAAAASGALLSKSVVCPTVAVLGCGVDVIYPAANERLYHEIVERGAVVSEFLRAAARNGFIFPFETA
jgi:DNA processing protein